jgi:MFS family permease
MGYAISAAVGAAVLAGAVVPLAGVPAIAGSQVVAAMRTSLIEIVSPLRDRRFLRLLAFGVWLAMANSVSVPAQDMYVRRVLEVNLFAILGLQAFLRAGQSGVSPWLGRLADRLSNRPVMAASLLLAATGPLFYALATPRHPWWIVGAWVVWIAFAGLNVCLPNLLLKLSPARNNIPYIAVFYAINGLAFAGGNTLSGALADFWGDRHLALLPGLPPVDYYHAAFVLGWLARSLGVVVLWWVVETQNSSQSLRVWGRNRREAATP